MPAAPRTRIASLYLALAIVGYIAPGIPMLLESVQTGNILFWTDPSRTLSELLANRTSTAFALDLLAAAGAACIWMTYEAQRLGMRDAWRFWILTAVFGLGGTLPLFLWFREQALARLAHGGTVGPIAAGAPTTK